jgi:hypothetical protein
MVVTTLPDGSQRVRSSLTLAEALREVERLRAHGIEAEIKSMFAPLYEQPTPPRRRWR